MHTTGDLAARFNMSRDTIRNYARDFADFLSDEATGIEPNARRQYSDKDALILATVANLRAKGLSVEQLKEGWRALERVQQLEGELDSLPIERDRTIEPWQTDTTELNVRINVLERELGEAKGELTTLKCRWPPCYGLRQYLSSAC